MQQEAHDETAQEEWHYRLDYGRWPVIIVPSPGTVDPALVDSGSLYEEFERFFARREPAGFIHDLRGVQRMDAARRRRFVEYVESHADLVRELVDGYAVLVDSKVMAGVVTAVLWLVPPPCPMKMFTSEAEAVSWLAARRERRDSQSADAAPTDQR